jgi:hypothetical protein
VYQVQRFRADTMQDLGGLDGFRRQGRQMIDDQG